MTTSTSPAQHDEAPLISNRFLYRLTSAIAVMATLTIGISIGGRMIGERMALGGHTDSTDAYSITIGMDRLRLEANTIRFARQRVDGLAERVDLYLAWPEMTGYSAAAKTRFNAASASDHLLFLQLSQSTMSRDMSGRLEPIYSHLFDGSGLKGPAGLTIHRLRAEAGYGSEVILTAERADKPDYVVRCLRPIDPSKATDGDCQRDFHAGQDLSVLYRFSSALLGDWSTIDDQVGAFIQSRHEQTERVRP